LSNYGYPVIVQHRKGKGVLTILHLIIVKFITFLCTTT